MCTYSTGGSHVQGGTYSGHKRDTYPGITYGTYTVGVPGSTMEAYLFFRLSGRLSFRHFSSPGSQGGVHTHGGILSRVYREYSAQRTTVLPWVGGTLRNVLLFSHG